MVLVEAKLRIWPLTIPMPRSSLAFNSRTWAEQVNHHISTQCISYHGVELLWRVDLFGTCQDGASLSWRYHIRNEQGYQIKKENNNNTSSRRAIEEHVRKSILLDEGPDKSKYISIWGVVFWSGVKSRPHLLLSHLMVEMMSSWLINSCSPFGRYFSTQGRFVPLVVLQACSSTSGILSVYFWNIETYFWRSLVSAKHICRVLLQPNFVSVSWSCQNRHYC